MSAVIAAFADEASLVEAVRRLRHAGHRRIETFTPYPVEALHALLPQPRSILPALVFIGGMAGLTLGFGMEWYGAAISYPLNIGGRPLASWPAFIPIAFEIAVLVAVLVTCIGFFSFARLPRFYQPLFELPSMTRATQDRFLLVIEQSEPEARLGDANAILVGSNPCSIEHWSS